MPHYVYMLLSKHKDKFISYVGYTNNLKKRLILHNTSRGAKFTKGKKWIIIYKQKHPNKSDALKDEYKLKKDYKLRNIIKNKFIKSEKKYIYNSTL